jgi:hypothetical protein
MSLNILKRLSSDYFGGQGRVSRLSELRASLSGQRGQLLSKEKKNSCKTRTFIAVQEKKTVFPFALRLQNYLTI